MRLDQLILFIRQLAGLVEHAVGYTDLAYIVHQGDIIVFLDGLVVVSKLPGEHLGILSHTGRVTLSVRILKVDNLRKRLYQLTQQLLVALLDIHQVVHMVGSSSADVQTGADSYTAGKEQRRDQGYLNYILIDKVMHADHRDIRADICYALAVGVKHRLIVREQPAVGIVALDSLYPSALEQGRDVLRKALVELDHFAEGVGLNIGPLVVLLEVGVRGIKVENDMAAVRLYLIYVKVLQERSVIDDAFEALSRSVILFINSVLEPFIYIIAVYLLSSELGRINEYLLPVISCRPVEHDYAKDRDSDHGKHYQQREHDKQLLVSVFDVLGFLVFIQ